MFDLKIGNAFEFLESFHASQDLARKGRGVQIFLYGRKILGGF